MKTGIALKMKNFGKDRDTRKHETIKRVFRAYQNAHPLVIIDFEWAEYNLIPLELNRLLEDLECEIHSQYRLYVTLASRSNDYDTRTKLGKRHIRALIHLLEQYHDHFGVCLVVGNPAFLSPYEQQKSLKNSLNALTKFIVQRTDQPILIGTEGVQNIVATLGKSYNVIPFFLLTDNLPNRIESYRAIAGTTPYTAVYAPYAYNKSKEWTINALWGYINRRKTTKQALKKEKIPIELIDAGPEQALASSHKDQILQIMGEAAESLCIFGGRERFQQFAKNAKKMGITHLIGYPLIDSWEQYAEMAETFHPTH